MIRSMTGFGRAQGPLGAAGAAEVSARSVNHRFLELTIKLRDGDAALEPVIRKAFSSLVSRGKVEVSIRIRREDGGGRTDVSIDEELAAAIVERVAAIAERLGVGGRLEARELLTIPGVVSLDNGGAELAAEEIAAVERVASEAARALVTMRETEGRQVALDLDRRIETLQSKTKELAARREEMAGRLLGNLRERLAALVPGLPIDPGRLEQEAALAADRSDVSEELQRLDGHLAQFRELLQTRAPVGKKLEFLSQEFLREMNTVCYKGKYLQIVRDIMEMKSETEKIR
jgi:uncharacterized protein (TIGR00255 family)